MATVDGGAHDDTLAGTAGDDRLSGLSGDDVLTDGYGGNDTLFGGDGADWLLVSRGYAATPGGVIVVDGGAGDDIVSFNTSFGERGVSLAISLGEGDDFLYLQDSAHVAIDAGAGDDRITLSVSAAVADASYVVTLGAGRDDVVLSVTEGSTGQVALNDFRAGEDFLDLQDFLTHALRNWTPDENPFATGHLRIAPAPIGSLLQVDYDGGGNDWRTIATLPESPAVLDAVGVSGRSPSGAPAQAETLAGGGASDYLRAGPGADLLRGGAGGDSLFGGIGDDTLAGDAGADFLDGGPGFDIVDYGASPGPISLYDNLSLGKPQLIVMTGDAYGDTWQNLEGARLTAFGDHADFTDLHLASAYGSQDTSGVWLDGAGGDDTLTGRPFDDTLLGGAGSDQLQGGSGADGLYGGEGGDRLAGGAGANTLDGGAGADVAVYAGFAHDYARAVTGGAGAMSGGPEGATDTLASVETLQFLDGALTFDTGSTAAQVVRLYDSFLGRAPDAAGFNSYLNYVAAGRSFQDMAANAAASPEFAKATADLTDTQYITYVYEHSLHREPDAYGMQQYLDALHSGALTRTSMIVQAAESPEHVALTAGVVAQGLWVPDEKVESLELLYDAAVQRQPDATGIAGYSAEVGAGTSYRQIANQMASSAEFLTAHAGQSDAQYVDSLYVAEVGRHADPMGLAAYTDQLAHGYSRGDILWETAFSAEHQAHVLAYADPLLVGA